MYAIDYYRSVFCSPHDKLPLSSVFEMNIIPLNQSVERDVEDMIRIGRRWARLVLVHKESDVFFTLGWVFEREEGSIDTGLRLKADQTSGRVNSFELKAKHLISVNVNLLFPCIATVCKNRFHPFAHSRVR